MKLVEAQGYSKAKAFETTNLDIELDMLKNATLAWKKAGSPMGTKDLNKFMSGYIKDKKAMGAYLVVDPSADDTRLRPYTVINEVTQGRRKASTVYQIKEAEFKVKMIDKVDEEGQTVTDENGDVVKVPKVTVVSTGAVEGRADRKDAALKTMKELIEANKKDYVIEIVKEITDGQKYAGYGQYTPSKSAKVGKFVFAVSE